MPASIQPLHLTLVLGSARPGRFCDTVATWMHDQIRQDGRFEADYADPVPARSPHPTHPPATTRLQADAFVVVTPEYNHGYTAALKALIDHAPRDAFSSRPVAFVSYGGISGGLRAVEQLRLVFAEMDAVTIRDTVSFAHAHTQFDDRGRLHESRYAVPAAHRLLTRLHWWASALHRARRDQDSGLSTAV